MIEFVKDNKKWIYIIVIMVVLFIGASRLINSCSHSAVDSLMNEIETENIIKLSMNDEKEAEEVLRGIAKKNGDWSIYPLSEEFLKKYNCKDGIFPQYNFEDVSGNLISKEMINNLKSFTIRLNNNIEVNGGYSYYVGNGLFKLWQNSTRTIDVVYCLNKRQEIEDIFITYEKQESDEYGDPVRDYDKEFTEKNIRLLTDLLFFDHWCWYYAMFPDRPVVRKEPLSKTFASKVWKDKNDKSQGFIDFFDGLDYTVGNVCWLRTKSKKEAFEDNDLYCVCKLYKDGEEPYYDNEIDYEPIKNYLYKVNISLDCDNKLDNIEVKYIKDISNDEVNEKYNFRLVDE